jgi:hypothetical protein
MPENGSFDSFLICGRATMNRLEGLYRTLTAMDRSMKDTSELG